ncbi:MAG: tRNA pseudouridine(38-40) synthase TruA [Bacteroidota bacterium]|nr:tRNA pseudouridine(38-40) synthase TruA [Bacteroidota bacterium]
MESDIGIERVLKPRYFLEISYEGTNYCGWQVQPNGISIQLILNEAISKLGRETVYCIGCGRTDSGVHAKSFYVHFDFSGLVDEVFFYRLNKILPKDISINSIYVANDHLAHARFSAYQRTYRYFYVSAKIPFAKLYATWNDQMLDVHIMNQCATMMLGIHDFTGLCKINKDVSSHLCEVTAAHWVQRGNWLIFEISANRFLRGMVRIVVGTLIKIGGGKMTIEAWEEVLYGGNKTLAAGAVPAQGLYLWQVKYPDNLMTKII